MHVFLQNMPAARTVAMRDDGGLKSVALAKFTMSTGYANPTKSARSAKSTESTTAAEFVEYAVSTRRTVLTISTMRHRLTE